MKTHSLVARRLLVACALMGGFGYHFATPTPLQAQSKVQSQLITVTGIVSDPEGPSIGATVMEKELPATVRQRILTVVSHSRSNPALHLWCHMSDARREKSRRLPVRIWTSSFSLMTKCSTKS